MIPKKYRKTRIPKKVEKQILEIKNDHQSGSVELTRKAADTLNLLIKNNSFSDEQDLKKKTAAACYKIFKTQQSMASIINLVNKTVHFLEEQRDDLKKNLLKFLNDYKENLEESTRKICKNTYKIIKKHNDILTHSYSSTVLESLIYAKKQGHDFEVYCTESRPMLEGRKLAEKLSKNDIKIKIIVDSGVNRIIDEIDLILVGGDAISERGILNKIGTNSIAMIAEKNNIDIYSLCDSNKVLPKNYSIKLDEKKNTDEIWETKTKILYQ
jgi:translation initiation factor 2B subunit (eIF-2B alpha/beta/delta family)